MPTYILIVVFNHHDNNSVSDDQTICDSIQTTIESQFRNCQFLQVKYISIAVTLAYPIGSYI